MGLTGERSRARFRGLLPEDGAIFMSNTQTMKECLRKKLFGLPSSFAEFVKNVKVGMVLFLFEYEKRLLYGVFKAASDGEIDIVPTAYGLSGKRFPAQVRVSRIWNCDPLTEHEFSDAIKDNYFSTKKFRFGLSKYQVQQLLHLFSSRKVSRDSGLFKLRELRRKRHGSSQHLERKSEDPQSYDVGATKDELSNSTMKFGCYGTTVPEKQVSLVGSECWLSGGSMKNIVSKQVSDACCSDIPEVSSLKHSPSCRINLSSVNLLVESHPWHNLQMVKGYDCCNYGDDLGESDLVVGEVLPSDDQVKSAPSHTGGDQYMSDPYIPVSQSSTSSLVESHQQHDLAMVKGYDCCNCSDQLGDFIPLFVPIDDERDLVEGEVLPPDDPIKSAPFYTVGDQYLSDPYIPMPIFGGESSEMVDANLDSTAGSDKCLHPNVVVESSSDARQAESVVFCRELCNTSEAEEISSTKRLYHDTPCEQKSVFSRLNFASKEIPEKENRARMDQFMDEMVGELQHKHDLCWKTMIGASSAERVGGGINLRRNSVFQRLGGGPRKTNSTRQKRSYSTMDAEYVEFMQMHSLDW